MRPRCGLSKTRTGHELEKLWSDSLRRFWSCEASTGNLVMSNGTAVTATQLGTTLTVPLVSVMLSCVAWSRLQLDRWPAEGDVSVLGAAG